MGGIEETITPVEQYVNVFLPRPVTTSMPGEATVSLRSESIQARPRECVPVATFSQKTTRPIAESITYTFPSGQNMVTAIQTTAMRRTAGNTTLPTFPVQLP